MNEMETEKQVVPLYNFREYMKWPRQEVDKKLTLKPRQPPPEYTNNWKIYLAIGVSIGGILVLVGLILLFTWKARRQVGNLAYSQLQQRNE